MTKTILIALTTAAPLTASGLEIPVLYPDSQRLSEDSAGLGRSIFGLPDSIAAAWFNDNSTKDAAGDDRDFNDGIGAVSFTGSIFTVTYIGGNTAHANLLGVEGRDEWLHIGDSITLPFTSGEEIVLKLLDTNTGSIWYTGPAWRNSDEATQAWVFQTGLPQTGVPEPAQFLLVGGALILIQRLWQGRRTA